jgi:hypothetical protein
MEGVNPGEAIRRTSNIYIEIRESGAVMHLVLRWIITGTITV